MTHPTVEDAEGPIDPSPSSSIGRSSVIPNLPVPSFTTFSRLVCGWGSSIESYTQQGRRKMRALLRARGAEGEREVACGRRGTWAGVTLRILDLLPECLDPHFRDLIVAGLY